MSPLLPGTTPAAPDDDGRPDPRLAAALAGADPAAVAALLPRVRLLVPVVALPPADGGAADAEMAVPTLVNADGLRALPVFSGYDELRAWRPDARPVPMTGARVLAAAGEEGYDGIVVDVAGPAAYTLRRDDIVRLTTSSG